MLKFKALLLLSVASLTNANSIIDTTSYQAITSDPRAFRIGEPIVILVIESTRAQSTAGTETQKSIEFDARGFDSANDKSVGIGISKEGQGNGKTVRNGSAATTLSAQITEIMPSGLLRVAGEQNLRINRENQKIVISGIVRPEDIMRDNTIHSHRLGDAKIEILGKGNVTDSQRQGIVSRILTWLKLP